jgi:hypothetical protein
MRLVAGLTVRERAHLAALGETSIARNRARKAEQTKLMKANPFA